MLQGERTDNIVIIKVQLISTQKPAWSVLVIRIISPISLISLISLILARIVTRLTISSDVARSCPLRPPAQPNAIDSLEGRLCILLQNVQSNKLYPVRCWGPVPQTPS